MRIQRVLLLALAVGCAGARARPNPLLVAGDAVPRADVRQRITHTPHNYFRFINTEFAREVCRRFQPVVATMPVVNLHGDAHLEKFAITAHSAGLADFDDSVNGPPVLDLVRFGVSIRLALDQRGWGASGASAVDRFFASYRQALAGLGSASTVAEPRVVTRHRVRFTASNEEFLASAESLMSPIAGPRQAEGHEGYRRYVALMRRLHPEMTEEFFVIKRLGALESSGIGSTRTARYLARIEGPTSSAADDIILEAKEVRDLSSVPCIQTQRGDALRVIAGPVTFGWQADPFLAVIPRSPDESATDLPWWVQSWTASYGEVQIADAFTSVDELLEVVDVVAAQMAAGHTSRLPHPLNRQLAELLRVALDEHGARITQVIDELTAETHDAFNRFRAGR